MAFTVRTNRAALNALGSLNSANSRLEAVFGRISTGLRISRAADDPAGLAMAENLDGQRRSLLQAQRNTHDGVSVLQTAEGAADEVANLVKRVRELAVQAASGTVTSTERGYIAAEYSTLVSEIDRISNVTEFNGVALGKGGGISIQVGIKADPSNQIGISLGDLGASSGLAIGEASLDLSTQSGAQSALAPLDLALGTLNGIRAGYGATQNRLSSTLNSLATYTENLSVAESGIRDADLAFETSQMVKFQIMQDASVAVLAQSNLMTRGILKLLT